MAIHLKVQRVVIEENPPSALFKPAQHYDIEESDSSNKEKAMQYSNGMFFSSSVFLEQILILATGSGLFSSASMSAVEMNMISAAMLLAFIWYVKSVFIIHAGGTRCVTSSTDNITKIHARITLNVECIRGYIFICLFYV